MKSHQWWKKNTMASVHFFFSLCSWFSALSWAITEQFALTTPANSASKLQRQHEQGAGTLQFASGGESMDWAVLSLMCECVSRRSHAHRLCPHGLTAERSIQSPQYASVDQLKGKSQSATLIFKSPSRMCRNLTFLLWQHCLFFQSCVSAEFFPPALALYSVILTEAITTGTCLSLLGNSRSHTQQF